ncbi:MAG: PD-(D/E)XK nuclease family protein [Acidimicrobiia bacterium]|nr:PD-(D/E)XK nuclease family protein [Acidimicrobiia bacterium]
MTDELTPAQQQVLDQLGADADHRPSFPTDLRQLLRARLEAGLAPSMHQLPPDETVFVNKHKLNLVHGCEARFLAEEEAPFEPNLAMVVGVVAHKAVELSINWRGEIVPAELVDQAVASIEHGEYWATDFLQSRTDRELAELRSDAVERFATFSECFPPLKSAWRPVTESRTTVELFDGRLVLRGKVDLTLGHARGNTAGKVLIDLKTGRFFSTHLDDLRFYALLETMRVGVPPRQLASYYLDQGELVPEQVTTRLLDTTEARVIDGIRSMIDLLTDEREPVKRPSGACRWCPILSTCNEGQDHLEADHDANP